MCRKRKQCQWMDTTREYRDKENAIEIRTLRNANTKKKLD